MTLQKGLCVLLLTLLVGCQNAQRTEAQVIYASNQTPRVVSRCFGSKLKGIINYIGKETGRKVIITSGHRSHGKTGSLHRTCRAADIRVPGVSIQRLRSIARKAPGIGGIGIYRGEPGLLHVDTGPRREWTH